MRSSIAVAKTDSGAHVAVMSKSTEIDTEIDNETTRSGLRAELFVSDVPRSTAFYRDVLGFETLRESPGGYTSVGREGAVLGLNPATHIPEGHPVRPKPGQAVGLGVELVVVVQDVAAIHARATASAHAGTSALVKQPWGLTDFRVVDPDGYYIRITGQSAAA
jgi:catechol 2,3-dioxygenase-like lactoylglutathione lyase family enzyme